MDMFDVGTQGKILSNVLYMSNQFGLYKKKNDNRTVIDDLMSTPPKEKRADMPTTPIAPIIKVGAVHQADLLFLPNDKGYRYALVVVDLGSRLCDGEPIQTKNQTEVIKAFETIYNRKKGVLKMPTAKVQFDAGSEFGKETTQYFNKHKVMVRHAKPGRHRQQAVVESYNKIIARAIFYDLHTKELKTKKTQTAWISNLPKIIKIINKHMREKIKELQKKPINDEIRCEGDTCNLFKLGDKVRVISDRPTDITGVKLAGKHRATDLRYDPQVRTIEDYVFTPAQPVRYKISGLDKVLYTKPQLQPVKR